MTDKQLMNVVFGIVQLFLGVKAGIVGGIAGGFGFALFLDAFYPRIGDGSSAAGLMTLGGVGIAALIGACIAFMIAICIMQAIRRVCFGGAA